MDCSSNHSIGKRVKALRKHRKLTQKQLGELIHTSSKHISEIERGITGMSIDTQILLSDSFHCSIDYLIKGSDYEPADSFLPPDIVQILRSADAKEKELLLNYLKLYSQLRKK